MAGLTPEQIKECEMRRIRENEKLKGIIEKAKADGVHKSIIRTLEVYDSCKTDAERMPIELYDGATEEEIVAFEKEWNIRLPEEFREFLKFSNGARLHEAVLDICGVQKDFKNYCSLYPENHPETRAELIEGGIPIPDNHFIIATNSGGGVICADLDTGEIVEWDFDFCECEIIGANFFDYLEEVVIDYMEWKERVNE